MDSRKTWFLDFDGTIVLQKSHLSDTDQILPSTIDFFKTFVKEDDMVIITTARDENEHKDRILSFMKKHSLKCDLVICNLNTGPRILINDTKPDGSRTAYSVNVKRDEGISRENIYDTKI